MRQDEQFSLLKNQVTLGKKGIIKLDDTKGQALQSGQVA